MDNLSVNCHSSICINGNIYVDPFKINTKLNNAKIVFITHSHYDHLDMGSIKNVINNQTIIVCTADSAKILEEENINNQIVVVEPNKSYEVQSIKFSTFPAYNVGHHHFLSLGFVGYTIVSNGVSYTICGDTDATEELKKIKTDVLFVPIGGTYTMNALEAANLTNIIKPKMVVPVHYNCIVGSKEDEKIFVQNVDKQIKVKILVK